MKKIAMHQDIDIFAPGYSRFSFLKSPYAAHQTFSAVDIYYGDFGGDAFSPVDGKVVDVKSFDSPTPFKEWDSKEYVIAIRQNDHVIKILHVKPDVSPGDVISIGDKIGTFIHNGYFIFWNDPVMHVEVRRPDDYLRASNCLRLTPNIEWEELPSCKNKKFGCRVESVNNRYALLSAPYEICGEIRGFALQNGFFDGYISSTKDEGFFGIVRPEGFSHHEVSDFAVTAGNSEIKCNGIAFSLSFNEPRIKVIPVKYGEKLFCAGDKILIKLGVR